MTDATTAVSAPNFAQLLYHDYEAESFLTFC
eukprot:COSAG03_NODE_21421_length_304_cov_0.941463_1_plen_30_part_10